MFPVIHPQRTLQQLIAVKGELKMMEIGLKLKAIQKNIVFVHVVLQLVWPGRRSQHEAVRLAQLRGALWAVSSRTNTGTLTCKFHAQNWFGGTKAKNTVFEFDLVKLSSWLLISWMRMKKRHKSIFLQYSRRVTDYTLWVTARLHEWKGGHGLNQEALRLSASWFPKNFIS